jgi:hypothetical protein
MYLKSWSEFYKSIGENPQFVLVTMTILLVVFIIFFRLNNALVSKGVEQAAFFSGITVSAFMVFIIIPAALYLLFNLIAFSNNMPAIEISYLGKHIGLTFSSFLWFFSCLTQKKEILGQAEIYTADSIVRIIWILIPLTILWLMNIKNYHGRMLLIPAILVVFAITGYKKAEETFITRDIDMETLRQVPVMGYFFEQKNNQGISVDGNFKKTVSAILLVITFSGLLAGVFTKHSLTGLVLAFSGLLGFVLMTQVTTTKKTATKYKSDPLNYKIDSMSRRLDSLYHRKGAESLEVINLAEAIEKAYDSAKAKNEFPDSLCSKYQELFSRKCKNN